MCDGDIFQRDRVWRICLGWFKHSIGTETPPEYANIYLQKRVYRLSGLLTNGHWVGNLASGICVSRESQFCQRANGRSPLKGSARTPRASTSDATLYIVPGRVGAGSV
eukprot:5022796-Pyramimonas_sp.AAC.1